MKTAKQHIEVWLDTDSDPSEPVWCVSLCAEDGEEIRCLSTHADESEAWEAVAAMHTGWTAGDGTGHEGYSLLDYWERSGDRYVYRGPDAHGIEPELTA